jgi:hypothetical protein
MKTIIYKSCEFWESEPIELTEEEYEIVKNKNSNELQDWVNEEINGMCFTSEKNIAIIEELDNE